MFKPLPPRIIDRFNPLPCRGLLLPASDGRSLPSSVQSRTSLWKGPQIDGITYSLLCKFLCCPERFRLQAVEGLREPWPWKHAVEYGSMFHAAMEASDGDKSWKPALQKYYHELLGKYPANEQDITKWYMLCCMQFPIYLKHWENHETQKTRKTIFEEKPFRFYYCHNPSIDPAFGPKAHPEHFTSLRGKLDCAFQRQGFIYLQENKTKGEIDQEGISKTINQNLQTMMYHIALRDLLPATDHKRISGTLYNVIRRPLSDRFALRQGKKEQLKAFIERVGKKIASEPERHFFRWTVPVGDRHIQAFKTETFNPILRWLCEWWESIKDDPFHPEKSNKHFRWPFGVYHSMGSGFRGDYFNLFTSGSRVGLEKITDLFPEVH